MMNGGQDILLSVKDVSKKFCKNIKWSMVHGSVDLMKSTVGLRSRQGKLRKQEFWALRNISFDLAKGKALGILGRNGSGKTTLMRLVSGIYPFETGEIMINGKITTVFALKSGMVPVFSGRENIYYKAAMYGMGKTEIDHKLHEIIDYSGLEKFIDAPLGTYSSGMRARLGFAIAMSTQPDIFIIDEALAVGDAEFKAKCIADIRKLARSKAVILISHSLYQIESVATDIMVIEQGEKIFESNDVESGIRYYVDKYNIPRNQWKV
jgi:homopolymeric O-antigen transport system ATP-binding protein